MKSIRAGVTKPGRGAMLFLIVCFFVACDGGRPSYALVKDVRDLHKYLDRGGDPNGITRKDSYKSRYTLLHRAAMEGDEEVVSVLLSAGADPNRRDNTGGTPLMAVLTTREHDSSRLGVLQLLLKVSDLSIKDDSEETAYDWAKKYGSAAEIELVGEALKSRSQSQQRNSPTRASVDSR